MSEMQVAAPAAVPGVPGQSATANQQNAVPTPNPQNAPELHEVKVNGQTRKYTVDELKNRAILADGAHEKFQKSSQTEKKYADWKEKAQKDAITALMDPELGLTKDQIRSQFENWYKKNFIDPETMTQEQKEALQWKEKAEAYEKEKQEREEKEKMTAQEQLDASVRQSVQEEIISVLDSSGLPKTRFTANRVAFWMKQNLKNGYDAPKEVIVQQVKDERNSIITSLIKEATPEQLFEMLGDDAVKKLRKYDMGRLQQRFSASGQPPVSTQTVMGTTKRSGGNKTMKDVDRYFNDLRREKR